MNNGLTTLILSLLTSVIGGTAWADENGILQEKAFDDWSAYETSLGEVRFSMASTLNESNSSLGFICLEGECDLFLNAQMSCEEDAEYPALVSLEDGVYPEILVCSELEDRYLLLFNDDSDIPAEVLLGNEVGIALGTSTIKFKAFYFSLSGSIKAMMTAKMWSENTPDIETVNNEIH